MTATEYNTQPSDTIVAGVGAYADTHHVVVLDRHGHRIADRQFTATFVGYRKLLTWLSGLGHIVHIGVESTGTYAAALTRFLISHGVAVVEVNTHTPILAPTAITAVPKDSSGRVEAIRTLRATRDSAAKARSSAWFDCGICWSPHRANYGKV
ncbi:IS110 family transposase [Rhodococcus opacus]|uniref:IS110 family transposase n=1 Tax=Rhodococcus opacus TaxID=37919 RepID=UPI0029493D0C|nr:transposase [Rhodococcus opacus]MDV6247200.1 transposase [Rhodococcus opacus]